MKSSPLLALVALALLTAPVAAQDPTTGFGSDPLHLAEVSLEPASPAPGSDAVLVVTMWTDPGWHVYGALEAVGQVPEVVLEAGGPLSAAGALQVPPGEGHESFGIESFWIQGEFQLRLPVTVSAGLGEGEHSLSGRVDYTVCNDQTCLPPSSIAFTHAFQAGAGTEGAAAGEGEPGDGAAPLEEPVEDEIDWSVEDVDFKLQHEMAVVGAKLVGWDTTAGGTMILELKLQMKDGWHVYGTKEEFGVPPRLIFPEERAFDPVGEAQLPEGVLHDSFGIESYWVEGGFILRQVLKAQDGLLDNVYEVSGEIEYIPCDDTTCLQPKRLTLDPVVFSVSEGGEDLGAEGMGAEGMEDSALSGMSGVGDVEGGLEGAAEAGDGAGADESESEGMLSFLIAAVLAGIFALSMPCTYPMIPITVSFFTKQAESKGGNALTLSMIYGLGIVVMFVLIGLLVGPWIMKFATNPWTNVVIGVVFVAFALSLFGMFTLQPPRFLMNAAGKAQTTDGALGVLLMGAALVITSFTCSAPFIGTLLAIGSTGEEMPALQKLTKISIGMGVFGLTMAVPFVILSLLPGKAKQMPKAGEWMNTLKVFFGFVELAAALKFFSNAEMVWKLGYLPQWLFLALWAVLFAAGGVYLFGAFSHSKPGMVQRSLAAVVLLVAHYCTWGAAGGPLDNAVMVPLAPPYHEFGDTESMSGRAMARSHVIVNNDFQLAMRTAEAEQKLLLVNFTGYT